MASETEHLADNTPAAVGGRGSTLSRLFDKIVTDPGIGFAAGNHVLSWAVAGSEGIAISGAALAITTGLRLYECFTSKDLFNSLYITASANMFLAGSALYNGFYTGGDMLTGAFSAAAFGFWGLSHVFLARMNANNGQHGKVVNNPFLHGLAGNVASIQVNGFQPVPTAVVAASTLRSFFKQYAHEHAPEGIGQFAAKHITPVRLTSAAFICGAVIAGVAQNYAYMSAQLIWAYAAFHLDKPQNKALITDTKQLFAPNHSP